MRLINVVIADRDEDFLACLKEGSTVGTNAGYGVVERIEDGYTFIGRFNPRHFNGSNSKNPQFDPIRIQVDSNGLVSDGSILYFRGGHVKVEDASPSEILSMEQKLHQAGL